MLQNRVMGLGSAVMLAALLGQITEGHAQLAPAERPPPPPPPPPVIKFAQSGMPRSIPENVKARLIPVAPQQQFAREQSRSISTHPAVSQAGYAQSGNIVQQRANAAQLPGIPNVQTRLAQPQTTNQPQAGYLQQQRTATPQFVFAQSHGTVQSQSQRTATPQSLRSQTVVQPGFSQSQRTLAGSITSYPAESQASYAHSPSSSQRQAVLAQQRVAAPLASLAPSQRDSGRAGFLKYGRLHTPARRTGTQRG